MNYEPFRAPLIPSKLLIEDCKVRSSKKQPTSHLYETDRAYYDADDILFIIEGKKEVTLEDENMKQMFK